MIQTLLIIFLFTLSGSVITYFYEGEKISPFLRLGAGNVIGSVLFGLIAFLAGCAFGLSPAIVILSVVITLLPLGVLIKKDFRGKFLSDLRSAANIDLKNAIYYAAFFVLFFVFFDRAMYETAQGIFTGSSHNLGDLPFHLGAIFSFSEGGNLPPENPSFAFAKFTYPFMADLVAACFVAVGAKASSAIFWQNITLALSLVVILENFAVRLTRNRLAGKLAPVIFLFCGGFGFIIFFRDYWQDGRSFFEFLWNMPGDYTIRPQGIRWGDSLTALFLTQRSLLLGMPLVLIVLTQLWKVFSTENGKEIYRDEGDERDKKTFSVFRFPFSIIPVGLLAGTLPLVHVHSLAVLFFVSAFLFFFRLDKWRVWIAFGLSVAVIAVPELMWAMTNSASRLGEFVDWNFGWDARGENIFVFWAKNLGLFLPLLLLGLYFITGRNDAKTKNTSTADKENEISPQINADENEVETENTNTPYHSSLITYHLYFYLPFLLIFFIANLVKFAPWEWDNIKVLIYWFAVSVPFVAWILAKLWEGGAVLKLTAAACLLVLTLSGGLDIWRVVSRQINNQVFSPDSIKIAAIIKQKTAPNALFLNAPTYNSAVVLSGRRSLMRYVGHLSSYGIDYQPREAEVRRIYEGTALAETFLKKNDIDYVIISPEERANLTVNEDFFSKYPVIAESGAYRVYQIKK